MSENTIRHIIATCVTLIGIFIYVSGYASGSRGWWWTVISVALLYIATYKLVDA